MGQCTRSIACILLLLLIIPFAYAPDYSATELFLTVYSDGYVDVSYGVLVDSSIPRVNVLLFGSNFEDIVIINQEEKILDYVINGTGLIIDTLGSNNILISYSTPALTSKAGLLWSLEIISPVTMGVLLPEGSTIISLSQIPLELSTVNNRPYITMPQGNSEVAYILGSVGTKEHAIVVLKETQNFIQGVKSRGIIVTSAESLLNQAQLAYNAANYVLAEQLANQAKNEAINAENLANNASTSITAANVAIQNAEKEGRTSNIAAAKENIQKASEKFAIGEYQNALNYANTAKEFANTSKADNNLLYIIIGLIGIIIIVGYFFIKRKPVEKPVISLQKAEKTDIDIDYIFTRNPELRLDDKEVIRFIAESGSEVFANEIRDRFEIPRTSAWRMIRRLISLGIVEEKKIGGQSLIKITEKYKKEKK